MKLRWTRSRRDAAVAIGLALAIGLGWGLEYHVWFGDQRLDDPLSYQGDALAVLAAVSAARRGGFAPFFSRVFPSLGAPFVASWNDWPIAEDWIYFLVGLLARAVGSVAAVNLSYALAMMTAGMSMFYVARRFGLRRDSAAMAGFLFGLSNYFICRTVHHFALVFVWFIPWNVLVSGWLASRRGIPIGSRRFVLAAVTTVCTAWGVVYYTFFAAQLYVLGAAAGALRHGWSRQRLKPIVALAALFIVAAVSVQLDSVFYGVSHGVNQGAVARSKADAELYSLKPVNLFIPPTFHRLEPMRELGRRGEAQTVIGGEYPSQYLGVVGGLSLVGLALYAFRMFSRGRTGLASGWAGLATWLVVAHSVGGVSALLGLFGFRLFRSVNRVSIVVLALALLFGAWWLGRLLARRPWWTRWLVASAVAVGGAWDQLGRLNPQEAVAGWRYAEADRKLVAAMEAALPHGAMVFELPAMHFPEVPPMMGVDTYEMFRPTFYASTLRFSHGDVKGRPSADWKFSVAGLPVPEMVARLRAANFAAVYINRKGFPDGAASLIRALEANGCRTIAVADVQDTLAMSL